jgi:hypothetical protein
MVKIRQVDASVMDKPQPKRAAPKTLSPKALERLEQERQFKRMLAKINDPSVVFEVRFEKDDKPLTVRQRLLRAAQEEGKEIVVRKSEKGWLVALATAERRSRRGRRRASGSAG